MQVQTPHWNIEEIEALIPHRFPFVLVDKVMSLSSGPDEKKRLGRKIVAIKNVTATEYFFQGHFPKWRIMPGVLQVEAMAQACALACVLPDDKEFTVAIASIENAKFRKPVRPGDTLEIRAEVIKERGPVFNARAECYVDGQKVSECTILAKAFI